MLIYTFLHNKVIETLVKKHVQELFLSSELLVGHVTDLRCSLQATTTTKKLLLARSQCRAASAAVSGPNLPLVEFAQRISKLQL